MIQAGFSESRPLLERVEEGGYEQTRLPANAQAIAFWVEIFGPRKGDKESLSIEAPDGSVLVKKESAIPKDKASWFTFIGKKRRQLSWPKGIYRAEYRLDREQAGKRVSVIRLVRSIEVL